VIINVIILVANNAATIINAANVVPPFRQLIKLVDL
jgi:hypothetical protein